MARPRPAFHVQSGEFNDNPVLLLHVGAPELIRAFPPASHDRVLKELGANRDWIGADVMVMTGLYGLELPALAAAVERFVQEPAAREELRGRLNP